MATKSSFKQPCPSCEAMVPIRDPKLIGRKIDCPKCKYRFVVEEPAEEVEDVEEVEEAPAKKGKAGATDITNEKPTNGKAGKGAVQRRADDDEDVEEAPKKKKSGGSPMLIVGISLAAVAVIALAVGGYFLFSGKSDDKPKGGGSANVNPGNTGAGDTKDTGSEVAQTPKDDDKPKPKQEDVTNLLPNDTHAVLNLPLDHLLGNSKINQALVKTPGAFHEGSFQRVWGVPPGDVSRVVLACNTEKKTVFSVMRTRVALKEDQIVAALQLKPESPVAGQKYYLLTKPLDALSTFLLQNALRKLMMAGSEDQPAKVALHFMDPFTVVCADVGPMNQFLEAKGQPKHLTKSAEEEAPQTEKKEEQPTRPGGPGGMRGMRPGRMPPGAEGKGPPPGTGPQAKGGGPQGPAGTPQPAGTGGPQAGKSGNTAPPGGGKNAPNGQGAKSPTGPNGRMPPGMATPGMFPGSSGASDAAPVSSSYLTVDPQLKAVLDQVEKVDAREEQSVLLSLALNHRLMPGITANSLLHVLFNPNQIPASLLKLAFQVAASEPQCLGLGVTAFAEKKFVANVALATKDAKAAQLVQTLLEKDLEAEVLPELELDFVSKSANANKRPGMTGTAPGTPGGMAGMPAGGFRGGMPQGGVPGGKMAPGGFPGGAGPGGFRGPGAGGFPATGATGEEQNQEKGKDGDYATWMKDDVVALQVNRKLPNGIPARWRLELELAGIYLRGLKTLSDPRSHIHDLAAAIQAYFKREGHFPRGTATPARGNPVLGWPPDRRVSWLKELLPYLGSGEFQKIKPNPEQAWYDGAANQKAGFTLIPYFLSPGSSFDSALVLYPNIPVRSPGRWAATHFVGIAGVGLDAAEYRNDDPATAKLRGVFGYDRETKKDDIKDGLEQTIVAIQVPPEPKSPWIAGGGSTVRGVSDDLDCVRPFVCARYPIKDGKEEDGTFAIMADGKVRFIPASIDPKLFQALCTIAGDDKIRKIDAIAPEVPSPDEQPSQPELRAETLPPVVAKPTPKGSDEGASSDLKNLEGSWTIVSGEVQGQALPPLALQALSGRAVFKGDKYTLIAADNKESGSLKLDDTKTPKTIDFLIADGKDKGKSELGIYALSGDELKLCVADSGNPRPSDFSTKGTANKQFVLKRAKADAKDKADTPQPFQLGQASEPRTTKDWEEYTSKEGGFTVLLPPGKVSDLNPQVNLPPVGRLKTPSKLTFHIRQVELPGSAGSFVASCMQYPKEVLAGGADAILKGVKAGAAAMGPGAKITSESKIEVEGHPGREWIVEIPDKGNLKWRAFLVENRLIQLIGGGDPKKVPQKDVQKFFDSFKFTAK